MSKTAPIFRVALDLEAEWNALRAQRDALLSAAKAIWAGVRDEDRELIDSRQAHSVVGIVALNETLKLLRAAIAACEPSKSTAEGSHK